MPQRDPLPLRQRLVPTGQAWFATVRHGGRTWLMFNLVNLHTREEHIRHLADLLDRTAQSWATEHPGRSGSRPATA